MVIKFFQAECGDAARISFFGNDNKYHNIFIDAGFERTFRFILGEEIKQIEMSGEHIDLWILSHIHDDHIGGVLKYLDLIKYDEYNDIVNQWYYNVPRNYPFVTKNNVSKISKAVSIKQADIIYEYLKTKAKISEMDITSELPIIDLFGLKLTILSPSIEKLGQLRNKYPIDGINELEKSESTEISEAKAAKENDYNTKLIDFNIKDFVEDMSVENGSSISVITEYNNKKTLWLADSHPSDIVIALKKMGYSTDNQFECDLVKVSHHGSSGNNSNELYDLIKCSNYLFSVNGENRHNLPFKECMARILRNKYRKIDLAYNLYFTYDNEVLRSIFNVDGINIINPFNFKAHYSNDKYSKFDFIEL